MCVGWGRPRVGGGGLGQGRVAPPHRLAEMIIAGTGGWKRGGTLFLVWDNLVQN